ncbi:MAG: TonB-dependent receptor, partial [Phaeodactylibacter sp.]|nr:TonB-dependent receptor [Phaeodactylibacter sp.]
EPLAGAGVFVLETQKGTSTDERGVYKLQGLEPGTYTLRVTYVGYERALRKGQIVKGTSQTILHVQLTETVFTMEGVTVRATRAQEEAPFTFKTLDQKELQVNDLGVDMPYLLQWTPGVVVTSDAGTGVGYTGIRIRGTDPTRVNVTINGIPLNDAESQGVFWVNMPDFAASVQDVQIQRGVGTSTHGAGAFGATINLNTSDLEPEAYGRLSTAFGSFNTWKGSANFGTGLLHDKFTLDGRISRIQSDGYIDRGSANLESFYLSGAYTGDKSLLRLVLFSGQEVTYQAWNGVPAAFVDDPELRTYNSAGTEKPGEPYENEVDNYGQTHYQALYHQFLSRNWNLDLALHYTRGAGYFEQYKADQNRLDYGLDTVFLAQDSIVTESDLVRRLWLDNHFYGGTYALNYVNNSSRLKVTLGGAWNQYLGAHYGERLWGELLPAGAEPVARYYENDATKTDFNTFLKVDYDLTEKLQIFGDLHFRQVDYTFLGFNRNLENVEQSVQLRFFNPKAGLAYVLNEQTDLYASFAVGQREPNRDDFVNSTPESRPTPEK